jgi:hypothetical protein
MISVPVVSQSVAQTSATTIVVVPSHGTEKGDGTMSAAARKAMEAGALPAGEADVKAKLAANRAARAAEAPVVSGVPAVFGESIVGPLAPEVLGVSKAGQSDPNGTPPDTTGAIGTNRFIQLVNRRYGIYSRTGALKSDGPLNEILFLDSSVNVFDPQIIWDPTDGKFYYIADAIFSDTDNRLAYGFSKTSKPNTIADFCNYTLGYGSEFPDFPKLGDSKYWTHTGVNVYQPSFIRSDIVHLEKAGKGKITSCPGISGARTNDLRDSGNFRVFTPTPANEIDTVNKGTAVARNLSLPSDKLWFFDITFPGGWPTVGPAKELMLPFTNSIPPAATQPNSGQVLDTSDTRPTQAVLARNPNRNYGWSFWTQQTVADSGTSGVRWYEVQPFTNPPTLWDSGLIGSAGQGYLFNASISPDRQVRRGTSRFGGSFVVDYSVTSKSMGIYPRIVSGSRRNGGPLDFVLVKDGVGPYLDFSCPNAGDECRWGDYSGATPNPNVEPGRDYGNVFVTNQYSGVANPGTGAANWRTWFARVQP